MSERHIVLFDLYATGHHGQYIQMLLKYWVDKRMRGRLSAVLAPEFPSLFPDVATFAAKHRETGITLTSIADSPHLEHGSLVQFVQRDLMHGRALRHTVRDLQPDHILIMYVDHAQLSLWTDLTFDYPVDVSGIYFRPSFHYASLGSPPISIGDRLGRMRKKVTLWGALRNPHLHTIFSLDPFAVESINRLSGVDKAVPLPDGIDLSDSAHSGRPPWPTRESGDKRSTALLFGVLNRRKGVMHVLESLRSLPASLQSRLRLALAGPVQDEERETILSAIEAARISTQVEIVLEEQFVPADRAQVYIASADIALVVYQQHVGSSNVLVRAAAAGTPVLGSDFGLVGEQIRRNRLGLAIDTTSATAIARGFAEFLERPGPISFDPDAAAAFAEANSAENFAATIFGRLTNSSEHRARSASLLDETR